MNVINGNEHIPINSLIQSGQSSSSSNNNNNSGPSHEKARLFIITTIFLVINTVLRSQHPYATKNYESVRWPYLFRVNQIAYHTVLAAFSILAPNIIRKLGMKKAFFMASIAVFAQTFNSITTSSCVSFPYLVYCENHLLFHVIHLFFSGIAGLGAAILYCGQAKYVSELGRAKNNQGTIFGVFYGVVSTSLLLGNSMLSYLEPSLKEPFYYHLTLLIFCAIASSLFVFLPSMKIAEIDDYTEANTSVPLLVTGNQEKEQLSIRAIAHDPKIHPVLTNIFFLGLILSFYPQYLYRSIERSLSVERPFYREDLSISIVFMVLGGAQFFGGITLGKLTDHEDRTKLSIFCSIALELAIIFNILAYYSRLYNWGIIAALAWGLGDCGTHIVCLTILAKDYGATLNVFGLYRFVQGTGVVIGDILHISMFTLPHYSFILFVAFIHGIAGSHVCTYGKYWDSGSKTK